MDATKTLTISGVTYTFPDEHAHGFLTEEQGGPYARIVPPNEGFLLEYSDASLRPNQQGPDVPTIPHINDVPGEHNSKIEVIRTNVGIVVCEPGLREYNCGLRIEDAGISWNVLFNRRAVNNSASIKEAAGKMLLKYRS